MAAGLDPLNCFGKAANSTLGSPLVVQIIDLSDRLVDGHDALYLAALILRVERKDLTSSLIDYLANSLLIIALILFRYGVEKFWMSDGLD